jgi:hypothetical protein
MVEKYKHLMVKNMTPNHLHDIGFKKQRDTYHIMRIFSPHGFNGVLGSTEMDHVNKNKKATDVGILNKFYNRFPMLKLMP